MSQIDYYRILQVERDAGSDRIKDAYRRLALKYHPDRNQDQKAASNMMKQINEAYAVLSDSEKRKSYDSMLNHFGESAHHRFRNSFSKDDIFKGADFQSIIDELARSFGLRGFDEIFKDFYDPMFLAFAPRSLDLTDRIEMPVQLKEWIKRFLKKW